MAYKLKPNKSIMSRFKVTKRGKLKRHHAKTSHLMSARSSKTKRRLGRPAILYEGLARNLRKHIGDELLAITGLQQMFFGLRETGSLRRGTPRFRDRKQNRALREIQQGETAAPGDQRKRD